MASPQRTLRRPPTASCIKRVVVSRRRIARRVAELAAQIASHYRDRELTILAVMTGSLVFLSDLIRRLPMVMRVEIVSVRSYPGRAMRSRGPHIDGKVATELAGKDVLILDDILDTGRTLQAIIDMVSAQGPGSLKSCVLLRKRRRGVPRRPRPDFVGFEVGDEFVVGYGLDYNNLYRNLPDLCVLKNSCLRQEHCAKEQT